MKSSVLHPSLFLLTVSLLIDSFGTPAFADSCTYSTLTTAIPANSLLVHSGNLSTCNGNVGIGTLNPNARLDLRGTTSDSTKVLIIQNSLQTSLLTIANDGTTNLGASGSGSVNFYIPSNKSLTIANTLTVTGTLDFEGPVSLSLPSSGGSFIFPKMIVGYFSAPNPTATPATSLWIQGQGLTSSNTSLLIQNTSLSTVLATYDNGTVGIGMSSPSETLEINGPLYLTGKGTGNPNTNAYITLTKQSVAPACNGSRAGAIVLTNIYTLCTCNGTQWNNPTGGTVCVF